MVDADGYEPIGDSGASFRQIAHLIDSYANDADVGADVDAGVGGGDEEEEHIPQNLQNLSKGWIEVAIGTEV